MRSAYSQLRQAPIQTLQQITCLADIRRAYIAAPFTHTLDGHLRLLVYREVLTGVNDVDDAARPDRLQIFDERACIASIGIRRVDALG